MIDLRPPLDVFKAAMARSAIVLLPGFAPVTADVIEIGALVERFPVNDGAWSLTKSRARFSFRLDQLPAPPRPDVSWPPPGTRITMDGRTWAVAGIDSSDGEVSHVIADPVT